MNYDLRKFGKLAPRHDRRTLRLERYFRIPELPPAPSAIDWGSLIQSWPMMGNDRLGDCTCAAAGHMIQCWRANVCVPDVHTDAEIIAAYSAITGYDPADPSSDQGAVELDVLKYWRKTGIAGHRIGAFASVQPGNVDHVRAAINLFGGVYIGLALPLSAQEQTVWDVPAAGEATPEAERAGSWGGHAVNIIGYDATGLTCVTWGDAQRISWAFWTLYCDEAYAIVSEDFLRGDGTAPSGFDLEQLTADLRAL